MKEQREIFSHMTEEESRCFSTYFIFATRRITYVFAQGLQGDWLSKSPCGFAYFLKEISPSNTVVAGPVM